MGLARAATAACDAACRLAGWVVAVPFFR